MHVKIYKLGFIFGRFSYLLLKEKQKYHINENVRQCLDHNSIEG